LKSAAPTRTRRNKNNNKKTSDIRSVLDPEIRNHNLMKLCVRKVGFVESGVIVTNRYMKFLALAVIVANNFLQ